MLLNRKLTESELREIERRLNDRTPEERPTLNSIAREMNMTSGQLRHRLLKAGWDIDIEYKLVPTGSQTGPRELTTA